MKDFTYENQGSNTYLVYSVSDDDVLDNMSLGMITNNTIPGFAQTLFMQIDSQKYFKYNVSAKVSASQLFEGVVNKKRIIGVFSGIANAIISSEDYMIDINSLVLDLDYIFSDVSTCETTLICIPVIQNEKINLLGFFKNIMFKTQFDQTENCDYIATIINYLNSSSSFSIYDFKNILDSISKNERLTTKAANVQKPVQSINTGVNTASPVIKKNNPPEKEIKREPVILPPDVIPDRNYIQQNQQVQTPVKKISDNKPIAQKNAPSQNDMNIETQSEEGEKISFMYLLQHYNKENAARYKSQKAAKKASKGQNTVAQSPKKSGHKPANTGYSIPGSQSNNNFAVPGAPANNNFNIPGTPSKNSFSVPGAPINNGGNAPKQQPKQKQASVTHQTPIAQNPVQQQAQYAQVPQMSVPQGQAANFGETTVLNGGGMIGETTVLGASSPEVQSQPHLIRTKNNERINLNKPVFRIGKEKSYVDYFVSDNTAVSRSHANIISRDGKYFIVDTNSTNHTYVNGGMIQSNVETPLSHGAKIRLANEDFEFKLY